MQIKFNVKTFQNIIFFFTIWIFFSLNSRHFKIPNAEIWRWVFLGLLIVIAFITSENFSLSPPTIMFFFIIAVVPSVFLGINQKESFIKFLSFIVVVWGGYIFFSSLDTKDETETALKVMLFVMIAFEIQTLIVVVTGMGGYSGSRMEGVTTNPNTLGVYSNLSFLAAFYWFDKCKGLKKFFFFLVMTLSVYTALASGSRTALVTIVLNIVLVWFVFFKNSLFRFAILIPLVVLLVMAVNGSLEHLGIEALNRLLDKKEGTTRGELWENGIKIWKRYPIFGCGYDQSVYLNVDANGFRYPFHNSYLSVLAEIGVFGVIVFGIGFLKDILVIIKSFLKNVKESNEISLFVICFIMMIELLIAAWSESFLFAVGSTEACTFWMLFVWALVYIKKFQFAQEKNNVVLGEKE